jgi:hypothetical protein
LLFIFLPPFCFFIYNLNTIVFNILSISSVFCASLWKEV